MSMGNIPLKYAASSYLLPIKEIINKIRMHNHEMNICLTQLIESNLDFSKLTQTKQNALSGLKCFIDKNDDGNCSDLEHAAWIKAAILETLAEKRRRIRMVDADWFQKHRIITRNQIANSLPLKSAYDVELMNDWAENCIPIQAGSQPARCEEESEQLVLAQLSLTNRISVLINLYWSEHTLFSGHPQLIKLMLDLAKYSDMPEQLRLAEWISHCQKNEPKKAGGLYAFFSRYIGGTRDITAHFYQTMIEIDISSIASLRSAEMNIGAIIDKLNPPLISDASSSYHGYTRL